MSKQENNIIINSKNDISPSNNISKSHKNILGNKTKRERIKQTPKLKESSSKSETNYKTQISRKYSDSIFYENDNSKLNNDFDFHEQICIQFNNNYTKQNIILMEDYMETSKVFSPLKRLVLLDWVMSICGYAQFKRETFHMTISLIDICLSKLKEISIDEVQLIGTSCLLISSKFFEPFIPNLKKYSEFGGEAYTIERIKEYELKLISLLEWKLNYSDILQWSNIFLHKWNVFIKENSNIFKFNEKDNNRYYCIYYYIIDSIVLDYYYRFYDMRNLCMSILYLSFGYQFKYINENELDLSKLKYYDNFFNKFVEQNEIFNIDNFRKYIPYSHQFINKDIITYLNERINENSKYEKVNIFYQDYDINKSIIAKNAIKNHLLFICDNN